jgi:plasmid stabilization system protein ParE
MRLHLRKSDDFIADFDQQFRWYDREAGWDTARRYLEAVDLTLQKLTELPDLGRLRQFAQPELHGLRSITVQRPFHRHLIFYRCDASTLEAWRVMPGERDLPRRLLEPPGSDAD